MTLTSCDVEISARFRPAWANSEQPPFILVV